MPCAQPAPTRCVHQGRSFSTGVLTHLMNTEPMHTAFRRIDAGSSEMVLSETRESLSGELDATATAPIDQARWRNRIRASGTVREVRVHETETGSSLGCEISDEAGR